MKVMLSKKNVRPIGKSNIQNFFYTQIHGSTKKLYKKLVHIQPTQEFIYSTAHQVSPERS